MCFFWNILGQGRSNRSDGPFFFVENFPTPLDRIQFVQIIEILFDQKPGGFGCGCIGGPGLRGLRLFVHHTLVSQEIMHM